MIIILVIMVLVSAYFSGSETGMMTLNRYKLRHKAKSGNRAARRVEKLLRVCMVMPGLLSPPAC